MHDRPPSLDLATVRQRLAARGGREYWRSLEELAGTPEFEEFLHDEFPRLAAVLGAGVDRRAFLKLMGASLGLAGLAACTKQPAETVVPYTRQPEEIVLGEPLYFATAMPLAGGALGLLVESHEGRPTKVEGNPEHPASLGATDALAQASILSLYDPDRSQVITSAGEIRTWADFRAALDQVLVAQRSGGGKGLRLLTETVVSPTLAQQIAQLRKAFPAARWHQFEPACGAAMLGARQALGQPVTTRYQLRQADVVLALDADALGSGPASVRYAREFTARRRPPEGAGTMNRLYVVETMPTVTGAMADHRLALRPSDIEPLARALAAALGVRCRAGAPSAAVAKATGWIRACAADLAQHRGACVVIPGAHQSPVVHALAHALNRALGNVGKTVVYTSPVEAEPVDQMASLRQLVDDMEAGAVEVLVILGGNPVYAAPADLRFAERLANVPLRVHLGLYDDETAALCHWHVPEAHFLESWSDTRAFDGTVTILQPLIAPLYGGKTAHEMLAALAGADRSSHDLVRDYWQAQFPGPSFEHFWRKSLHDGVVAGTASLPVDVALRADWDVATAPPTVAPGLEIAFRLDPAVFDGRFANNGWLQEWPKPITKLTWDNAALLAPATAERLGIGNEDTLALTYRGRTVHAPAWIVPGHAADAVTVHLGYGRTRAGAAGTGAGFDAYALQTSDAPAAGGGLELTRTGETWSLAVTHTHQTMEERPLVLTATLAEYRAHPDFARELAEEPPRDLSLYPPHAYPGYAWGMAIDLSACTGCSACVLACQAENNIPVVGKTEVARGHEMHWLRIDRYYTGDLDAPRTVHQPVPCMHCENAPCEAVCPVNATVHSSEGLNDMVYNRCVGTRYCSNNCPYKVRRFNFYLYQDWTTETLKMARNPDVTVRSRGVMEKCTYCVQRIEHGRIHAEQAGRPIRDGDVVTACQQVCPADAIVFGDINDPKSRVAMLKAEARNYALLGGLNTRPRTTYLAGLRNPNPALDEENG
jgi:MoCo/4Fe-4S cofactor protein with predicted Tat translocation signal